MAIFNPQIQLRLSSLVHFQIIQHAQNFPSILLAENIDLPEAITVASPANTPNPRLVTVPFSSMHATLPITIIMIPQTICENTKISCIPFGAKQYSQNKKKVVGYPENGNTKS